MMPTDREHAGVSTHKSRSGLQRLLPALRYSWQGLRAAWRHEAAWRQELVLAAILIPTALYLPVTGAAKALLIASVLLVLIVELCNSALEAVVDRISTETHPLSGRAKDIGSAAVLVALINTVLVWSLVLWG